MAVKIKEQMKALAEFLDQMLDDKHGRKVRKKNISRLSTLSKKRVDRRVIGYRRRR